MTRRYNDRGDEFEILSPDDDREPRVVVNNTTPSPPRFGFPIIFLGASAFAYLNLPDTADQVPHYAGAVAVGAATSFGCRYGPIVLGGLMSAAGLAIGGGASAALTRDAESTVAGGAIAAFALGCVGAVVGPVIGIVAGYSLSYPVVKPLVESRAQAANIQHLSHEQLAAMTLVPESDVELRNGRFVVRPAPTPT
jgi:hypothetical protein